MPSFHSEGTLPVTQILVKSWCRMTLDDITAVAVIGLPNNDVILLRSLCCVRCVRKQYSLCYITARAENNKLKGLSFYIAEDEAESLPLAQRETLAALSVRITGAFVQSVEGD